MKKVSVLGKRSSGLPDKEPTQLAPLEAWMTAKTAGKVRIRTLEEQLRTSEARYQALVLATGQIAWSAPTDGSGAEVRDWCYFTGQDPDSLLGEGWLQAVHPDDRARALDTWKASIHESRIYEIEYRVRRRDGAYRWLMVRGVPLIGEDGQLREWVGTATDVTDRKQAEAESARLAAIVMSSSDAIVSKTLDGIVTTWNASAEEMFGYSADEIVGKPIRLLIPAERQNEEDEILARLRAGQRIEHYETVRVTKDGHLLDVSLTISPIVDRSGAIVGASKTIYNIMPRRRLEQAILDQEERFRVTFEQSPVGIAHVAPDGRWLRVNNRMCEILGYTREELLTLTVQEVTHPADLDSDTAQMEKMLRGEITRYELEKRYLRKDGSLTWGNLTVALVHKPDSTPDYFIRVIEDITERKRLEREVRERAAELQATFDAMTDAVFLFDANGQIIDANPTARRQLPVDLEPFNAKSHHARVAPYEPRDERGERLSDADWPIARLLRGETLTGPKAVEIQVKLPDGRERLMNVGGAPIVDASGHVIGAVGVTRDVTERSALERRTRESLDALLQIAHSLVGSFGSDEPGSGQEAAGETIVYRLLELVRDVLGSDFVSLLRTDSQTQTGSETETLTPAVVVGHSDVAAAAWQVEQASVSLCQFVTAEELATLRSGEPVATELSPNPLGIVTSLLAPLRAGPVLLGVLRADYGPESHRFMPEEVAMAGAVAQLVALVIERDRLLTEAAEARAHAMALQETTRRMDEFLGIVSHELKSPLTVILANLQLALRNLEQTPDPSARVVRLLTSVERQARRQERLLGDLIDTARIDAGRLELHAGPGDLAAIVEDAVHDLGNVWPDREITLRLPDGGRAPVPVEADSDRVAQVVINYLTNALKYSPGDQPVEVCLSVLDEAPETGAIWARLEVSDHGPGLTLQDQVRIWDRFHRVPGVEVLSGIGVGLGLGLHISREIIDRHGGRVGVDSAPGQGATFWFELPLSTLYENGDLQAGRIKL